MHKYIIVGIINTICGLLIIYFAMFFLRLDPLLSNALGYCAGSIFGYFLNKKWAFKGGEKYNGQAFLYFLIVGLSYLANIIIVRLGMIEFGQNPYIIQFIGIAAYTIISYTSLKLIVFKK